jgi:hypothetical protein
LTINQQGQDVLGGHGPVLISLLASDGGMAGDELQLGFGSGIPLVSQGGFEDS